jgi:serine/threonine protein kinase
MTHWERITEIFGAARELPPEARGPFLDEACERDSTLRSDVEALLAADVGQPGFLDEPLMGDGVVARLAASAGLATGTVLKGRYRIDSTLGSGGQAFVYVADDMLLSRRVVVKIIRADAEHHEILRARLEHEKRALAALDHPAVVGILDVGVLDDGAPFLVIQYVEGVSVRQLLDGGPLERRRVADIVRGIGSALSAAHAAGVAHQDLKPENVMVQSLVDGTEAVKLIDFGIAKIDRPDITSDITTVVLAGSVRYMAPEQFEGRNSPRGDIYAFALTVCELLCGHPDPRALPHRMHTKVRRLLDAALAYRPEDRPQDVKRWADDLAQALGSRTIPISPRAVMPSLLGVAVATLVGLPLASDAVDRSSYRFRPFAIESEQSDGAVWAPDGHSIAYAGRVAGAWQLFVRPVTGDTPTQVTSLPTDVGSIFWWPDSSRIGFVSDRQLWTVGLAGRSPEILQRDGILAADLSPDGNTLVTWRIEVGDTSSGALWVASPPTAAPHKYAPLFQVSNAYNPVHPRFSRDGRKLLASFYGPNAQLWMLPFPESVSASPPRRLFANVNFAEPPTMSWMPDSRRVVLAFVELSHAEELWIADTEAQTLARITAGTEQSDQPGVSPDGTRLTFTSYVDNYDLVELPLDGGPMRDVLATSRGECCAAWIPGTTKFVYVSNRAGLPEIRLRDRADRSDTTLASTGDFRQNAALANLDVGAPSPDGSRLAFVEHAATGFSIWVTPIKGGSPLRLTRTETPAETAPSWSPDGQWISFLAKVGTTRMLARSRVGSTEPPQMILRAGAEEATTWCCVPQWSPSGEWIAYVVNSGIRLVSPDGARQRQLSSTHPLALAWSSDAQHVYAIADGPDHRATFSSIDINTGAERAIRTFDPDVTFGTPWNPGVRASLAPDGSSLLTTVWRPHADIWMLEGFDRAHGPLDRLLATLSLRSLR